MGTVRAFVTRLRDSLNAAIGDVAFGMEDGAVSIAGLVFGVAASTNDRSIVLLVQEAGVDGVASRQALQARFVEPGRDAGFARHHQPLARQCGDVVRRPPPGP